MDPQGAGGQKGRNKFTVWLLVLQMVSIVKRVATVNGLVGNIALWKSDGFHGTTLLYFENICFKLLVPFLTGLEPLMPRKQTPPPKRFSHATEVHSTNT